MNNITFTSTDEKRLRELARKVKYDYRTTKEEVQEYITLIRNKAVVKAERSCQEETYYSQATFDATENWHQ